MLEDKVPHVDSSFDHLLADCLELCHAHEWMDDLAASSLLGQYFSHIKMAGQWL